MFVVQMSPEALFRFLDSFPAFAITIGNNEGEASERKRRGRPPKEQPVLPGSKEDLVGDSSESA